MLTITNTTQSFILTTTPNNNNNKQPFNKINLLQNITKLKSTFPINQHQNQNLFSIKMYNTHHLLITNSNTTKKPQTTTLPNTILETLNSILNTNKTISLNTYTFQQPPKHSIDTIKNNLTIKKLPIIDIKNLKKSHTKFTITNLLNKNKTTYIESTQQQSLTHKITIKSLHNKVSKQKNTTTNLLHKTHITNYLNHPNIIPIHTLKHDHKNHIQLIMKHIKNTK